LHFCNPLFYIQLIIFFVVILSDDLTTVIYIFHHYGITAFKDGFQSLSDGFSLSLTFIIQLYCRFYSVSLTSGIFRLAASLFTQTVSNFDYLSFAVQGNSPAILRRSVLCGLRRCPNQMFSETLPVIVRVLSTNGK
jgi:hypothetical protein